MWRASDGELSAFVSRVQDFMYVRTRISASHSELKSFPLMIRRNGEGTHKLQKSARTASQRMTYKATKVFKERQAMTCLVLIAF